MDGSNENGFGEQHPSLATVRGLLANAEGRRLVVHNGDISYARWRPAKLRPVSFRLRSPNCSLASTWQWLPANSQVLW